MIFLLACWAGGSNDTESTPPDSIEDTDTDIDTDTFEIRDIFIFQEEPDEMDLDLANGEYEEEAFYVCLDLVAEVIFEDEPTELPAVEYRWEVVNPLTPDSVDFIEGESTDGTITLASTNYQKYDEVSLTVVIKGQDIETEGKTSEKIQFTDTTMELSVDELDGNSAKTGIWLNAQLKDVFTQRRYKYENAPFTDCEGDITSFNIGFYSDVTGEDPFSSGPGDFAPFVNCLNTEECNDPPITAGDSWGAYQYRTTIEASGTEIENYEDFMDREPLVEAVLDNSPVESIELKLVQNNGSEDIYDDFNSSVPLNCSLTYKDYDKDAHISSYVFYHKGTGAPDEEWQVLESGTVDGSQLRVTSPKQSWAPEVYLSQTEILAQEFHIKCQVTITDPGQNGLYDTSDNTTYEAFSYCVTEDEQMVNCNVSEM